MNVVHSSVGFLRFERLTHALDRLGLDGCFEPSRGSIGWRVRRAFSRNRLRREPAASGLWIAHAATP